MEKTLAFESFFYFIHQIGWLLNMFYDQLDVAFNSGEIWQISKYIYNSKYSLLVHFVPL